MEKTNLLGIDDALLIFKQAKILLESSESSLESAKRNKAFSSQTEHDIIFKEIKTFLKKN
jgi:hypothetical protein